MAKTGNAEPTIEKLNTDHNEHMLIAKRREGINPNIKSAKPCDDSTANKLINSILP